jgi:methylthioribose-1-phosphate isomerase
LSVLIEAYRSGKRIHVYVDETRPLLQGSRITAWELERAGVPYTLITDSMAGMVMSEGRVDLAIVGADRICSNGDTANKVGTYSLAVLANAHGIPFYVAAPSSTIDLNCKSGEQIEIEMRNPEELTKLFDHSIAPRGASVFNPAFDVTPAKLVTGIITEHDLLEPPYEESIFRVFSSKD